MEMLILLCPHVHMFKDANHLRITVHVHDKADLQLVPPTKLHKRQDENDKMMTQASSAVCIVYRVCVPFPQWAPALPNPQ